MPIYKCRVHYSSYEDMEIEAKDGEYAQDKAQENSGYNMKAVEDTLEVSQVDVELSDNQYTDQQELQDRERDSERK